MILPPGLTYDLARFQGSDCHVLRVDLSRCRIAAVPVAQSFPMIYTDCPRPPELAKATGAIASVGGGFEMTRWAEDDGKPTGVWNEPLHPLVIADEVWTTGVDPGSAFIQGDGRAWVQPARPFITLWVNAATPIPIEHVNRGHAGTVLFTPRGGTNEHPSFGRCYARLKLDGPWVTKPGVYADRRQLIVEAVGTYGFPVLPETVVVESTAPLGLNVGATVTLTQGFPGSDAVTGMTPLVTDGVNVVEDVYGGPDPGGPDAPYRNRNPRTALGVDEAGTTALVVVVAGRVATSRGLTLKGFAHFLVTQGAYSATNMDGGGSSHLWIRDSQGKTGNGLVMDGCYGNGTLKGTRPNIYATGIFAR